MEVLIRSDVADVDRDYLRQSVKSMLEERLCLCGEYQSPSLLIEGDKARCAGCIRFREIPLVIAGAFECAHHTQTFMLMLEAAEAWTEGRFVDPERHLHLMAAPTALCVN